MGLWDLRGGLTGFGWWGVGLTILFSSLTPSLPRSTHPEQTGAVPNPGLNPLHQSDLRKKHSSIPERRRHSSRSSGNRGRLMKCRLALKRQRGVRSGCQTKSLRSCAFPINSCSALKTRFWLLFERRKFQNHVSENESQLPMESSAVTLRVQTVS